MTGVLAATVVGLCATPALAATKYFDGPLRSSESDTYRDRNGLVAQCRNARGTVTGEGTVKVPPPGAWGAGTWDGTRYRYRVVCQLPG